MDGILFMNQKLRFGVNYVPSKNWWYSWMDWDASSIREDLQAIASLGMDHIRIQCLWPVFQPNASYVSEAALDRLHELLDLADEAKLDVEVTVLDGWLSGFVFNPSWKGNRNMFTDSDVIAAEVLLYRTIAHRISKHPRFMGFDLGNELGVMVQFGGGPEPDICDAWSTDMLALCEELAPGKFHVSGTDHRHWFGTTGFSRPHIATAGGVTSLHTWVEFTGALKHYGPLDIGSLHLGEYSIELAKAYHTDLNRPVWLQEFGASAEWMPRADIPTFAEATIRNSATCDHLWRFTWWCSHDINKKFAEFLPLEYDLGLFDSHNNIKPTGELLAKLIREFHAQTPATIKRPQALVCREEEFVTPEGEETAWAFGKRYMDAIAQGIRPAVVLESRAHDTDYLKSRGIEELIS